jgi:small GTP-binding protein
VVLCGEPGAGKTSLLQRIKGGEPPNVWIPTVIATHYRLSGDDLNFWDVGGDPKLRYIARTYFKEIDVGVVVFDLSSHSSFDAVEEWVKRLRCENETKEVQIIITGNKADLSRVVTKEEAEAFANRVHGGYSEVCVKDGTGVNELVRHISGLCNVPAAREPAKSVDEHTGCCIVE